MDFGLNANVGTVRSLLFVDDIELKSKSRLSKSIIFSKYFFKSSTSISITKKNSGTTEFSATIKLYNICSTETKL